MKELSLNILDIAMNSVKASASDVCITLTETADALSFCIEDNGCGMKPDFLAVVTDPFSTTRTTRKVGLGLPFLKLAAEQTGGSMSIESRHRDSFPDEHGTKTEAVFIKSSIDYTPLGDIISTVTTLIQGNDNIHWVFEHKTDKGTVRLDTAELKAVLEDVPLSSPEIISWIGDFLKEAYRDIDYKLSYSL